MEESGRMPSSAVTISSDSMTVEALLSAALDPDDLH